MMRWINNPEVDISAELFVKTTCQNKLFSPLLNPPLSYIFLSKCCLPRLVHLHSPSPPVLLMINYMIIPIRWLITASPSPFLPEVLCSHSWSHSDSRGTTAVPGAAPPDPHLSSTDSDWWSFNGEQGLATATSAAESLTSHYLSCPATRALTLLDVLVL